MCENFDSKIETDLCDNKNDEKLLKNSTERKEDFAFGARKEEVNKVFDKERNAIVRFMDFFPIQILKRSTDTLSIVFNKKRSFKALNGLKRSPSMW